MEIDGVHLLTDHWYEALQVEGAQSLGTWQSRHLKGLAAVTSHGLGKGSVIYVGTYLNPAIFQSLLPTLEKLTGIQPLWPDLPKGALARLRESGERKVWFFINTNDQAVEIPTSPIGKDLTGDCPAEGGPLSLEAYEVTVIQA